MTKTEYKKRTIADNKRFIRICDNTRAFSTLSMQAMVTRAINKAIGIK